MSKKDKIFKWYFSPKQTAFLFAGGFVCLSAFDHLRETTKDMSEFNDTKKAFEDITKINEFIYKEVYADYDAYINLIANEIVESDMNNSAIEVFTAYDGLEHNGLISLGEKFTYQKPAYEPIGNLGISVVLGEGVSRNEAYNLYHVFKKLNYECGIVVGENYTDKPTGKSDHVVVYVKDGDMYYLFDPTNHTFYLRSFLGKYISVDDEEIKFYPSMYSDDLYNQLSNNMPFYCYFHDDYSSHITYDTRRSKAIEKLQEKWDYYRDYEHKYLLYYEFEIQNNLENYETKLKELLENQDVMRLELK